jgi:hypothetical protein
MFYQQGKQMVQFVMIDFVAGRTNLANVCLAESLMREFISNEEMHPQHREVLEKFEEQKLLVSWDMYNFINKTCFDEKVSCVLPKILIANINVPLI